MSPKLENTLDQSKKQEVSERPADVCGINASVWAVEPREGKKRDIRSWLTAEPQGTLALKEGEEKDDSTMERDQRRAWKLGREVLEVMADGTQVQRDRKWLSIDLVILKVTLKTPEPLSEDRKVEFRWQQVKEWMKTEKKSK